MTSESGRLSRGRIVFYVIILLVCAILVYLLAYRGLQMFRVPSSSMAPSLEAGDYIATMDDETYDRGEIVVLDDPMSPGDYLVKRIVGVAGDMIEIQFGRLLINGAYASEPYIAEPMQYDFGPFEVPAGNVIVLGDNRNNSDDSSTWKNEEGRPAPAVSVDSIVGRVVYRYLPFSRAGAIPSYPLQAVDSGAS